LIKSLEVALAAQNALWKKNEEIGQNLTEKFIKNQQIKLQGCFIYQKKGNFSGFTLKQITKLLVIFKISLYVNKVVLKMSNFAENFEIFGTYF